MYNKIVCFSLVVLVLFSCGKKAKYTEGPLSSVVKLISAEEVRNFDEAIKYIDVDKVYSACREENKIPVDCWKERVNFDYQLGKTKKFTNNFKYHEYHDYKIIESVIGSHAKVEFVPLKSDAGIKKKVMELDLRNGTWVVVKVTFF